MTLSFVLNSCWLDLKPPSLKGVPVLALPTGNFKRISTRRPFSGLWVRVGVSGPMSGDAADAHCALWAWLRSATQGQMVVRYDLETQEMTAGGLL